jgi:uncharacterized protein
MNDLLEKVKLAKFPYWREMICLFVGGSALHGAKVEGYDDLDIYGVYVEPPEKIIGVDHYEHFVWSTSGSDQKNGKDDVDITLYGLQKWANLACKGNPSILHFVFAENTLVNPSTAWDTWFHTVRSRRQLFLCKKHSKQFLGFASAQLMRMTGEKCRNVNRPDLVEKYGYDTKFAMHVIRLLVECEELMKTGVITLPSVEKQLLIDIRTGKYDQQWVIDEANRRFELCKSAEEKSLLKPEIDRNMVSRIVAEGYRKHWEKFKI